MKEIGEKLREARESIGVSVEEVAEDLKMRPTQIENIEAQTNKVKSETKAIDAKLPFEVDSLKAQIRKSNLSGDAQEIVNSYLDEQQDAEIRVKNYTISQLDAVTQKCFAEIEKMNYEDLSIMIGWLETNERILNLQKQRELSDKQMEELSSLIDVNTFPHKLES